ncbi:uncharacterized protein HKW66_Vig0079840 [Vigna angularis]|uniref:Uncharacterized protein n=1 Tax=Phaseolus angularis TaxID=3914 RepID=A0A8T0K4V4_PHAAN|nr:uncharacterized protein HKW66_Vig0079840 [Vigna angularis]
MNRKLGYGAQLRANLDPTKGVGRLRQQDGGHGSRNPLRRGSGGRCKTQGVSSGGAVVGADLGGSSKYSNENFEGRRGERLKFLNRDVAADDNLAHPRNGSAGGRVQRLEEHRTSRGVWCAPAALENLEDRVPPTPGKGLALRAGHGGPSPEPVGYRWTARAAPATREGSSRAGRGTDWERALRGLCPGRRTVDSELCSELQSEEIQSSAGKRRE